MANITVNFMPGTFNNIIKLLRAQRMQSKPVSDNDDFQVGEEYVQDENVRAMSDNSIVVEDVKMEQIDEESGTAKKSDALNASTVSIAMSHHNMRYSIDPE